MVRRSQAVDGRLVDKANKKELKSYYVPKGLSKSEKSEKKAEEYASTHKMLSCFESKEMWINYLSSAFQSGDKINPCGDCIDKICQK